METNREIRSLDITDAEVRAARRGRTVEGFGIVFNKESKNLGGFTEIIDSSAVDGVIENSDILALLNHDESRGVLARSTNGEGTLNLSIEKFGVKYRFDSPDTVLGDEVLSGVRRGDIRTSSFSFSVSDGQRWDKKPDGTYLRTITKFDEIYDVSPVYREAYADTTVAVRSLVELRTGEAEKATAEAQKRIADLEEELKKKDSPSDTTDAPEADPVVAKPDKNYFENLKKQIPKK